MEMCDMSVVEDSDVNVDEWNLGNIPIEIFFHICSYLDARFISQSLSLVCKRFHEILSDAAMWRSRITKRWGSKYPPISVDSNDFNWKLACVCIEDQYELWHRKDVKMKSIIRKDIHYASVDAVHLMNSGVLCVSGSRDRSIVVWNLTNLLNGGTEVSYQISSDAHKGWIWKLSSFGETVYSCSWDTTIRSWHLTHNLQPLSVFRNHMNINPPLLLLDFQLDMDLEGTSDPNNLTKPLLKDSASYEQDLAISLAAQQIQECLDGSSCQLRNFPVQLACDMSLCQRHLSAKLGTVWTVKDGREILLSSYFFRCQTAALSLVCTKNLVAAGTYTRSVMLFDTRVGECQISSYTAHRRAVLALSMSGDFIVSASEDQTLAVWDQRAGKVLKRLQLYEKRADENAFPMCLSFSNDLLYVGDTKGHLHLIDPTQGQYDIVKSYEMGHTAKLTCVKHGMGSILTSSTDGTVRISTPTQKPETIAVINSHAGEVTGFDYKNNVLAVGGTDNAVEIWVPCSS